MTLLNEAVEIIRELLKYGKHEGECDNLPEKEDPCSLHLEVSAERERRAKDFLEFIESKRTELHLKGIMKDDTRTKR